MGEVESDTMQGKRDVRIVSFSASGIGGSSWSYHQSSSVNNKSLREINDTSNQRLLTTFFTKVPPANLAPPSCLASTTNCNKVSIDPVVLVNDIKAASAAFLVGGWGDRDDKSNVGSCSAILLILGVVLSVVK